RDLAAVGADRQPRRNADLVLAVVLERDDVEPGHGALVAGELALDPGLARVLAVLQRRGDGEQRAARDVVERGAPEPVREFLGDEAGGEPALAEALVAGQRGAGRAL